MSWGSPSPTLNNTWNCNSDNDTGILAKLRRLKIQEGLLLQNINKIMLKNCDNGEEFITISSDYKSLISNLRNSYRDIKNLFDSLKCNTTSHEALKSCDIEDIKTDVLELEAKIKKFKTCLIMEQASLKSDEQEIIKQMNVFTEDHGKITKHPKIKAKPFNDIVPSPVKNIINSPFKCQEVQQFQDFLKSYHKNGGWNEYSHNIFIQSWIKHFGSTNDFNDETDISEIEKSNRFISEIIEKIPGINKDDIIQHGEWYLEYLRLKRCQQDALNKWRAKKKIIKKSQLNDKRKKYTEMKTLSLDLVEENPQHTRRVNFVVSDEMKRIEDMFLVDSFEETSHTSDGCDGDLYTNDLGIASIVKNDIRVGNVKSASPQEVFKFEKPRGRFHFAKPTQQWTNMCNNRRLSNHNIPTYIPQLENINKLCVPKWRMSVKNK